MNQNNKHTDRSAIFGLLFSFPFLLLNMIVSFRIEPLYGAFSSVPGVRNNPLLPLFLLVLFPVGARVAASPMLPQKKGARSRFILLNFTVTFLLLAAFSVLTTALGWELYRCEIARIPQCD